MAKVEGRKGTRESSFLGNVPARPPHHPASQTAKLRKWQVEVRGTVLTWAVQLTAPNV